MGDSNTAQDLVLIRSSLSKLILTNHISIPNTQGLMLKFASPRAALSRRPRNISPC